MKIDGKKIAASFYSFLKKERKKIREKICLAVILVGQSNEQLSFVKIKHLVAKKIGVDFQFFHFKTEPTFQSFLTKIQEISHNPKIHGIIIQQPLPSRLDTFSLYDFIPQKKEIEGYHLKSPFLPPLGLATLTILKSIYLQTTNIKKILIDEEKDRSLFKKILKEKKIVLVGQGRTGGKPIGKVFNYFKISYIGINSKTTHPKQYLKEADIIISAVGKKIIFSDMLKKGVILINVGLRRENNHLKGDYDENEIKQIASFYTPTPGGIGPIDVGYLYYNLIKAAKIQNK